MNTADLKTLAALPGVGRATAKRIIAARPFKSVKDLSKVKGMSKAKVEALGSEVTVEAAHEAKPTPSAPAQAAEKPAGARSRPRRQPPRLLQKRRAPPVNCSPGKK